MVLEISAEQMAVYRATAQQRRQQHHRREIQHAVDQHDNEAERVVAVEQQAQVEQRLAAGQVHR